MRLKVIVEPGAKEDIIRIKKWYNTQRPGLGNEFTSELDGSINLINKNPLHFQVRFKELRVIILNKFPYLVYYLYENDIIHIIAVLAAKQDQEEIIENR